MKECVRWDGDNGAGGPSQLFYPYFLGVQSDGSGHKPAPETLWLALWWNKSLTE